MEKRIKEYFGLLDRELSVRAGEAGDACSSRYFVDSIYFGGGTPSLADPELIEGMIEKIRKTYLISDDVEISMEANPGTLDYGKLIGYRKAGVNRLSIGLQSFDPGILKTLGRIHSEEDFVRSFREARDAGFENISVDLMFGVPGQSIETWASTLDRLMELKPEHVSFYSLQIEEGTRFYDQYKMGDMVPVSDEDDRKMYHDAIRCLEENGYHWYEISNAALPGKECRHNLKYWTFKDYLGIGASASSFLDSVRKTNPGGEYAEYIMAGLAGKSTPGACPVESQLTKNQVAQDSTPGVCQAGSQLAENQVAQDSTPGACQAGSQPAENQVAQDSTPGACQAADLLIEYHKNSDFDNAADFMITGLRLTCGVSESEFERRFGKSVWEFFTEAHDDLQGFFIDGFVQEENGRLYITEEGMDVSNRIMECFV